MMFGVKYYLESCVTIVHWQTRLTRIFLDSMPMPSRSSKKKIALIACVKQKREGKHTASELYTSAWFVKVKEYIECSDFDEWYILSAKHHLVSPGDEIDAYTEHLNQFKPKQIKEWAEITAQQVKERRLEQEQLFIFGSEKYRSIIPYLPDSQIEEPLKGMGISQQMGWMHQQSMEKEPFSDKNHV
ncbi:DUF6884 domain-containing protein [Ammoniphilus sp. CFH 90114]|uniref:DUF6884 domain-containing protein n=1 Tax=Ammoniphilus sp. CFH 90114 TaxID=2493665 RepID=UPI00100F4C11|nr:DUF6884 domain-containing protein [Ammoniphilus sp. CFH 90114]RXT14951.1 hypothetical protein EIZ39_01715 [Ammoniphilus sp. CFH 90114]